MQNSWKPDTISVIQLRDKILGGEIVVPQYQRGIVWTQTQKDKLIDSLKKGYPFGTILLYRMNNRDRIIDGLQRSSTIFDFMQNPSRFFNENDIDLEMIQSIIRLMEVNGNLERIRDEVKRKFVNWIKDDHPTMDSVRNIQYYKFASKLIESFPILDRKQDKIIEIITPTVDKYKSICEKLIGISLPVIVIEGDEAQLPEVFERINSLGTTLTKHQIYAATWSHESIKINTNHTYLLEINRNRYDVLGDGNFEIENYNSSDFLANRTLNYFEFVFAFGKYISKEYPFLFQYEDNHKKVESIGFNLLNACILGKNNDINTLNYRMKNLLTTDENLNIFLDEVISSIKIVDKCLKKITRFKGNRRTDGPHILHSELLITSIVASLFINKHISYNLDANGKPIDILVNVRHNNTNWNIFESKFKKWFVKSYIIDVMQQKWRGAGDSRLDAVILNKDAYTKPIEWIEFKRSLNAWFIDLNQDRQEWRRISQVKDQEIVFLGITYAALFTFLDTQNDQNYDVEHLVTKKLLKTQLERFNGDLKLPISSIGNLCLLPEYINRSKKDKVLYEDEVYLEKIHGHITIEDIESKYSLTNRGELMFFVNPNITLEELKLKYNKFIDNRFERMCSIIEANYNIL